MKIDGVIFIRESGDCFAKPVKLEGCYVNVSDFKGLIRDREKHIDVFYDGLI